MDADIIQGPVDPPSEYLDTLQGYNLSFNQYCLLDIARQVWDAENYYFMGVPFPVGGDIFFNQPGSGNVLQTFSGDIPIPPFALLTKITFFSSNAGNFKLRIYDKGGKVDMIFKQFSIVQNVGSEMTGQIGGGLMPAQDDPFGPYYLLERKFVMPPGLLHVEITDLTGVQNNMIQILMAFAVPRTTQGTSLQTVTEN